jgi:serine/threonine-protein kinase
LPVASVTRLAAALAYYGRRDLAISLLMQAQALHRDDFWVNEYLGRELLVSGRPEDAIRFFAVAAGVRPRSGLALSGLGKALQLDGQASEAIDVLREASRLRPDDALAHVALGSALLMLGKTREAAAEFAEAKRLKPADWVVRDQVALAYSDRGDWPTAVEEQKELVRRFPRSAVVHKAFAHALEANGRLDDAIAEFREAVRLDPRFSAAYLYLGRALTDAGEYQAAIEALRRVGPGPPPADPKLDAATLMAQTERLIGLEARLPAVIDGSDHPADAETMAEFARLAFARHEYEVSARLWSEAFADSPTLAIDSVAGDHYQAARAAALACTGTSRPEASPETRTQWLEQAVAWLEADLSSSALVLESGTARQHAAIARRLGRWQVDPALAGLRETRLVSDLSESKRLALQDLWRRIDDARIRAASARSQAEGMRRNS